MFSTPILFIIFNRPDHTEKVIENFRRVKPARVYVAADGPREGNAKDKELCERTRSLIDTIDWPCEVKKLYRTANLGCGKAVSQAISWFFDNEEMGIVLEDDILPDLSFYSYCADLLDRYKNDEQIMHINGCNFQQGVVRGEGSYYFSAFPHVWGWAGWRRAWKKYEFNLSDINYFYNLDKLNYYFNNKKAKASWYEIFFKMNQKMIDTWDYQWNYAIWKNQGKVITPNVNLISNIGFGANATHTFDSDNKFSNLATSFLKITTHPKERRIDSEADKFTIEYTS
ncbi:nucleotide-diphospho-sugar transferase [Sphingobacteriaceae bacterium]|nr:nucleotide-diphospho-sugar transferase [Sphingobacteriaceae bacterium]